MFGFEYGLMPEQIYTSFLEDCFENYNKINSEKDFKVFFSSPNDFSQVESENEFDCSVFDWKIIHKVFRCLYTEINSIPIIAFLIVPYNERSNTKMIEWVSAEFSSDKAEFSGEIGQLNPLVNPDADMKLIPEIEFGFPIVVLSTKVDSILLDSISSMINYYFSETPNKKIE